MARAGTDGEEDLHTKVVASYASVRNQIMEALFKSSADTFFRPSLEGLQETVRSMEPMVEDMELSEIASPRYVFMVNKFIPLLELVKHCIGNFFGTERQTSLSRVGNLTASTCHWLGVELSASYMLAISFKKDIDIFHKRLKDLYTDYVKEELEKLAQSNENVADEDVLELLRYLIPKIRHEAPKPSPAPIFKKINIILDALETEFHSRTQQQPSPGQISVPHNMPRLFCLLKEVKLLHRFLNGDHGLYIPNHLRESECALRMFVTDDVVSRLKGIDQRHKKRQRGKQRQKKMWSSVVFFVLGVIMFACEFDKPEYPKRPSEFVLIAIMAIFILWLGYEVYRQAFTQVRLEQSNAQRQSANVNNPCCGRFHLLIFAAVVMTVVALILAVPDERKKYDVFLNFRGSTEIRYTVAGVFHTSLEKANITTFFDERNSRKTKRFLDEIGSAINTSLGAITIFSENYGESEYCLDELLLILEREKTYQGYMIRPIFYDLEPDDLTNPLSKFGQGLQKHYTIQPKYKVEQWKEALETVTLIGGDVHKSSHQHLDELVHKVVEDFQNELGRIRHTDDDTIQKWSGLIMKATQPFTRLLRHIKLVIDLRN